MKLKYKKMLAIDFGTSNIKIVEGSFSKGYLDIFDNILIDLPNGVYEDGYIKDIEALKVIVDSALKLNNIRRRDTIAVINSTDILTRNISFPNVDFDEIDGLIKYKINDYIPIGLDDYVIQYINQGNYMENENKKIKLFVIAIPKKIIEIHFNFLKDLGLKPRILDFQANAISKYISFAEINKLGSNIKIKNISNIDIGYSSTKLTILKDANIEVSRIMPLGLKDILKNINMDLIESELIEELFIIKEFNKEICQISIALDEFLIKLFESLDRVFKYYNLLETDNDIDLILLQGGISKLEKIVSEFEDYFKIKTFRIDDINLSTSKDVYLYSNAIGGLIRGGSQ